MSNTIVFPSEFVQHFDACNRFGFKHKPLFYELKTHTLRSFGAPDGYDLQVFYKYRHYWAQLYHYDMIWDYKEVTPPQEWKQKLYEAWTKENEDPNEMIECSDSDDDMRLIWSDTAMVRCVSKHQHILERWILWVKDGENAVRPRVYHCPTDHFHYHAYATDRHGDIVKESNGFAFYQQLAKGTVATVGDEKTPEELQPFASLKWLLRWCRQNTPLPHERRTDAEPVAEPVEGH